MLSTCQTRTVRIEVKPIFLTLPDQPKEPEYQWIKIYQNDVIVGASLPIQEVRVLEDYLIKVDLYMKQLNEAIEYYKTD